MVRESRWSVKWLFHVFLIWSHYFYEFCTFDHIITNMLFMSCFTFVRHTFYKKTFTSILLESVLTSKTNHRYHFLWKKIPRQQPKISTYIIKNINIFNSVRLLLFIKKSILTISLTNIFNTVLSLSIKK